MKCLKWVFSVHMYSLMTSFKYIILFLCSISKYRAIKIEILSDSKFCSRLLSVVCISS